MINNKVIMINMWCSERLFGCPRACGRKWRPYPLTKLYTLCEPILPTPGQVQQYDTTRSGKGLTLET